MKFAKYLETSANGGFWHEWNKLNLDLKGNAGKLLNSSRYEKILDKKLRISTCLDNFFKILPYDNDNHLNKSSMEKKDFGKIVTSEAILSSFTSHVFQRLSTT